MSEQVLKVITFNLKRDSRFARKKIWENRRELAAGVIRDSGASVVGVQELMPVMRQDIASLLEGYSLFGWGRKRNLGDEHSDIIVKNEYVDVLFHDTFWLSKSPAKIGSRYAFAIFPRICTVVEVYLKKVRQRIRVFNTHFDHLLPVARNLEVKVIFDRIAEYQRIDPLPTILMGDLNAGPRSGSVRRIRERSVKNGPHFQDVFAALQNGGQGVNTFHYFKGKDNTTRRLDYIFVTEEFEVLDVQLDKRSEDGFYPSDHYPVICTLRLRTQDAKSQAAD